MGILARFKTIMEANVNSFLDGIEDKNLGKMIDQSIRDMESDLAEVKKETAAVMANQKRDERLIAEKKEKIDKLQTAAVNAVKAGAEDDAKKLLSEKAKETEELTQLEANLQISTKNSEQMKAMHDKLENDLEQLRTRQSRIKATLANAKAQETVNKAMSKNSENGVKSFSRLEDRANQMLDEAMAKSELNMDDNSTSALADKYASDVSSAAIDDELAAIKASLK